MRTVEDGQAEAGELRTGQRDALAPAERELRGPLEHEEEGVERLVRAYDHARVRARARSRARGVALALASPEANVLHDAQVLAETALAQQARHQLPRHVLLRERLHRYTAQQHQQQETVLAFKQRATGINCLRDADKYSIKVSISVKIISKLLSVRNSTSTSDRQYASERTNKIESQPN